MAALCFDYKEKRKGEHNNSCTKDTENEKTRGIRTCI